MQCSCGFGSAASRLLLLQMGGLVTTRYCAAGACTAEVEVLALCSGHCRPALLVLHHWGWWNALGDGIDRGLFYSQPEGQLTAFSHVSCCACCAASRWAACIDRGLLFSSQRDSSSCSLR